MTAETIMNTDWVTVSNRGVLTKVAVVSLTERSAPKTGGLHPNWDLAGGEE